LGKGKKIGIGVGLGILGFFLFASVVGSMMTQEEEQELRNMSIEELHESSVTWYYDDLLRNPEKYKGKIIEFDGEIFRVDLLDNGDYALIVWEGGGLDQLIVVWKGGRFLDGDEISGYGVFGGVIDMGSMFVENYYNPKPYVEGIQLTCYNC